LPFSGFVVYILSMGLDRKKLAIIHIVKKELGLTEAEYRQILLNVAGVPSAKELTEPLFKKLMNYLVRSKRYRVNLFGLTLKQKMYIQHLIRDLGWDEDHLNNFVRKYYHKPDFESLTRKDAIRMIESLKNVRMHQRKAA